MSETLGKYDLLQVLGKGAMGTVYEGFDPVIARRLAIKTVRLPDAEDLEAQEELARFKREAQAAGRLSHPNIVGVFDYGETPEIAYIVMEFVDGATLKHIIDKKERFELPEIVRLMEGILTGLQYSHDRGVVHRDIKPANIMLTKEGEVKIADFGIARIESSSMTQAGAMLGTPAYMSPEQFMGQTVDARTDIYAAGVLLYQLLTGEKPFDGGLTAIMHKVLNTEPPPPSALSVTVPHSFDDVVRRAMARRPEDRFANALEFIRALKAAAAAKESASPSLTGEDFADGDATLVVPSRAATAPALATPPPAAVAPRRQGPPAALLGGGGAFLLLLIGAGAFLLLGHHAPPPAAAPVAANALPPTSPAQRQTVLAATLASLPCTLLSGSVTGATPTLSGLAGAGAPQAALTAQLDSLPASLAPLSSVQTIDGPYCDVLNALRPYHYLFSNPGLRLQLALAGNRQVLHDGDLITIREAMPIFDGYLQTDYFSGDGSVFHLYPTPQDPLKIQPGGTIKTLGDPKSGGASWGVSAPFGTDLVVSIASATPLFATPRPQSESASDYLAALRSALQQEAGAGGALAVTAVPVVTEPK